MNSIHTGACDRFFDPEIPNMGEFFTALSPFQVKDSATVCSLFFVLDVRLFHFFARRAFHL